MKDTTAHDQKLLKFLETKEIQWVNDARTETICISALGNDYDKTNFIHYALLINQYEKGFKKDKTN